MKLYGFDEKGLAIWEHAVSDEEKTPFGINLSGCSPHPLCKTIKIHGSFQFFQRCGEGMWKRVFMEVLPHNHPDRFIGTGSCKKKVMNHK